MVKVYVGSRSTTQSGMPVDHVRPVEFDGKKLASLTDYYGGGDSRGRTETLYQVDDRYVVHVRDWSNWQGETTVLNLVEITEKDLDVGGEFEELGREAGLARSLTLDEALS